MLRWFSRPVSLCPVGRALRRPRLDAVPAVLFVGTAWGGWIGGCSGALVGAAYLVVGAVFGFPVGVVVGNVVGLPASVVVAIVCWRVGRPGDVDRLQRALARTLCGLWLVLVVPFVVAILTLPFRAGVDIDLLAVPALLAALALPAALVAYLLGRANAALTKAWYRPFGWIEPAPAAVPTPAVSAVAR